MGGRSLLERVIPLSFRNVAIEQHWRSIDIETFGAGGWDQPKAFFPGDLV